MNRVVPLVAWLVGLLSQLTNGSIRDEIQNIQDQQWTWRLRESPELASLTGARKYNDRVARFDIARYETNKDYISSLLQRLNKLQADPTFKTLSLSEKTNYDILVDMLQTYVDGFQWYLYTIGNPVSFLEGPQHEIDHSFQILPFVVGQDFENSLSRIGQVSNQIQDMITLMRGSIKRQLTNHNVSMAAVADQIEGIISKGSRCQWYTLFEERVKNSTLSSLEKSELLSKANDIVVDQIIPAYQSLKKFITEEYIPNCRSQYGVSSFPKGAEFYQAALQWHLSVKMTADQVHEKGLQEVDRISKNMQKVMDRHNFTGSIKEYFDYLSANPKFHIKSQDEGLRDFSDIIFNRIMPKLGRLFKDIPNQPVVIVPMQYDGPLGQYSAGSADGSLPGQFIVNLRNPELVKTFEMAALSLHETIPGHHLQSIYSQSATLPDYRRYTNSIGYYQIPFNIPFYTAYIEGWGLYAEFLGEELGVYKDDYELMGRYSGEIFRACRLVIDTGIHAKGWSRDQAVEYMLKYTSASRHNTQVEIERYITWPGQACAYKIGELKIRELREMASQRLGDHFDVRDFHSTILNAGSLPLRLLETVVNDWIKEQLKSVIPDPVG